MKKIRTLLVIFIVGLFLFLGIKSNAASYPSTLVTPNLIYPTSATTIELGENGIINVADHTAYYCEPFSCTTNYDYVQVHIKTIKGDSSYIVLQELINGKWTPALGVSGSDIFVNDELDFNIYLMYCGKDKTNYITPNGADTSKVFSVSTNSSSSYAIQAYHQYRIMVYNPYHWNGKNSIIVATLQVRNL
ncbi:MAG: hypothetical protein NC310_08680 [Roseburia sp.]|nr:hypothetical protein [Anaeroplasma bactoclasticum]MCM1197123.1 hypothetical protein [Roseburia sp.]MCM1557547.1 hypothetical protein [Anaeroplasma bactoclasticum]